MPTPTYDTSSPVMVTGATGYAAGWIVKSLLEKGFTVHAPVRSPNDPAKVGYLQDIADQSDGAIKFFKADLLDEGSYDEAMKDCSVVFHTASPFISNVKDPQKDLVNPAVLGTNNVLNSANRTDTVKRVVLTSSCAAIYGDSLDTLQAPNGRIDESVWNTSSSLTHVPYSYSKTLAEQSAWKIAEAQNQWKLVVVNPALIVGPALGDKPTSDSFTLLIEFAKGSLKAGAPHLEFGAADVRDIAEAHLRAAFIEEAEGRNIVFNKTISVMEMADVLKTKWGSEYGLPSRQMPKFLLWLLGPMVNSAFTRKWVSRNVGHHWRGDNSKAIRELGMTYRPVEDALIEMFEYMREKKLVD